MDRLLLLQEFELDDKIFNVAGENWRWTDG